MIQGTSGGRPEELQDALRSIQTKLSPRYSEDAAALWPVRRAIQAKNYAQAVYLLEKDPGFKTRAQVLEPEMQIVREMGLDLAQALEMVETSYDLQSLSDPYLVWSKRWEIFLREIFLPLMEDYYHEPEVEQIAPIAFRIAHQLDPVFERQFREAWGQRHDWNNNAIGILEVALLSKGYLWEYSAFFGANLGKITHVGTVPWGQDRRLWLKVHPLSSAARSFPNAWHDWLIVQTPARGMGKEEIEDITTSFCTNSSRARL